MLLCWLAPGVTVSSLRDPMLGVGLISLCQKKNPRPEPSSLSLPSSSPSSSDAAHAGWLLETPSLCASPCWTAGFTCCGSAGYPLLVSAVEQTGLLPHRQVPLLVQRSTCGVTTLRRSLPQTRGSCTSEKGFALGLLLATGYWK